MKLTKAYLRQHGDSMKRIIKVEVVTGGTNKKTETHELKGKELDEWGKAHGIKTEEVKDDNTGI